MSLLVNLEKSGIPVILNAGFTFPDYLEPKTSKVYSFVNLKKGIVYLDVSLLSGSISVYVGSNKDVSISQKKFHYDMSMKMETHKQIKLDVVKLGLDKERDIYFRIANNKLDPSSYTLNVFENNTKMPIEAGITKNLELAPM